MINKEQLEILRFTGVYMMFMMTISLMLMLYFAAVDDDHTTVIDMRGCERDIEVFIAFPGVILFSIFVLSIELYKFAEKRDLFEMLIVMIPITISLFVLMFVTIFWGR